MVGRQCTMVVFLLLWMFVAVVECDSQHSYDNDDGIPIVMWESEPETTVQLEETTEPMDVTTTPMADGVEFQVEGSEGSWPSGSGVGAQQGIWTDGQST